MRRTSAALSVLVCAALAACSAGSDGTAIDSASPSGSTARESGSITVLAAASLTETFTTLGTQFEQDHPGTTVAFSFGGSPALAAQIIDGAPADVFASASQTTMDTVVAAGGATDPTTFAHNSMEIAVPPSNPGEVDSLDDLASSDVKTALCQEKAPCGAIAQTVFDNAGITVEPVTLEPDVKSVLSKVTMGEVDAGVVYVTDVEAAGTDVLGVEIPADVNATTSYPIAILAHSANRATAQAFVDYVLSAAGQSVLTAAGFARS